MSVVTEQREFFKMEVNVTTPSVILENVEIAFDKIILYSEIDDKTIIITNRKAVFEKERTCEGFKVKVFILNEDDELEDRIDWLLEEEYEIEDLELKITSISNSKEFTYKINTLIGEQVVKTVEIELDPNLKKSLTFLSSYIEDNSLTNEIYSIVNASDDLKDIISEIADINTI